MKSTRLLLLLLSISIAGWAQSDLKSQLTAKRVTLPNGWKLSPHGSSIALGDLPLNVVVSPDQRYLLVTNNGQSVQSLQLIDAATSKLLDSQELPKSWYGLKVASDNKTVFVSGGNRPAIKIVNPNATLTNSSTGKTLAGWLPIDLDGTIYTIPFYTG